MQYFTNRHTINSVQQSMYKDSSIGNLIENRKILSMSGDLKTHINRK